MKRTPLSLNENAVEQYRVRDKATGAIVTDAVLEAMASAMASARSIAEQIEAAATSIMADTTALPAANALRLRKTAGALGEKAAKTLDAARARALSEVERVQAGMKLPAPANAAEIRGALRSMKEADRVKVLAGLDDATFASVLAAPSWLSGIGDAEVNLRAASWRAKRFPAETDRITRLRKALEALERGGTDLIAFVGTISDGTSARLAEAAERSAREAIAAAQAAE